MRPNPREFVGFAGKFRVFCLLILRQNRLKSHKFAVSHRKNGQEMCIRDSFCAISSTSGTATEVTAFSIITDYQKGIKYPIADFEITPDVAIVDPDLSLIHIFR